MEYSRKYGSVLRNWFTNGRSVGKAELIAAMPGRRLSSCRCKRIEEEDDDDDDAADEDDASAVLLLMWLMLVRRDSSRLRAVIGRGLAPNGFVDRQLLTLLLTLLLLLLGNDENDATLQQFVTTTTTTMSRGGNIMNQHGVNCAS